MKEIFIKDSSMEVMTFMLTGSFKIKMGNTTM